MPLSQNPPRKHHYIPIFYSKQWAGDDGLVERFTLEHRGLVDRRVHPARVGWTDDLYKIPGEDGPEAQQMESNFFRRLDGHASRALAKMCAIPPQELTEYDVGHWIMFMRSLLLRSPVELARYKSRGLQVWRNILGELADRYEDLRLPSDPPTHADYLALRTDDEGAASALKALPTILSSEAAMSALAQAPWILFDVPVGSPSLLLSDSPIVKTNGFKTENGHLAMPLSPRKFLLIAKNNEVATRIGHTPIKHLAKALNAGVVSQARHFIAATDLSQTYFIRRHFTS